MSDCRKQPCADGEPWPLLNGGNASHRERARWSCLSWRLLGVPGPSGGIALCMKRRLVMLATLSLTLSLPVAKDAAGFPSHCPSLAMLSLTLSLPVAKDATEASTSVSACEGIRRTGSMSHAAGPCHSGGRERLPASHFSFCGERAPLVGERQGDDTERTEASSEESRRRLGGIRGSVS